MTNSHHNFNDLAKPKKAPPPFSLRLTFEERAKLEAAANGVPLGTYIRAVLFEQDLKKVRRRGHKPVTDHAELARLLAALGASRLSSNVNQIAKAVHLGALPVTPETEAELQAACGDIAAMRNMLVNALGLDASRGPEGGL